MTKTARKVASNRGITLALLTAPGKRNVDPRRHPIVVLRRRDRLHRYRANPFAGGAVSAPASRFVYRCGVETGST
jgi:hypothetical protein